MASCSGSPLGSYTGKSSDCGSHLDERKRKRLISNRESARRSRMRKRNREHDLTAQVGQLTVKNGRIVESLTSTVRLYLDMEAENSVLQARVLELRNRLESLNRIVDYVNSMNPFCGRDEVGDGYVNCNMWDGLCVNQQPLMANVGTLM